MFERRKTFVGGRWISASDGEVVRRYNPASTSEVVSEVPALTPDDATTAVDHAERARPAWRDAGALARGRVLIDAAAIIRQRADDIARDIVSEVGKTLTEAAAEVGAAAAFLEYYGGLGRGTQGEIVADRRDGVSTWWQREPLGIVCLITPWNDPCATPARKLGPALIAGNAVLLKPAEQTALSALHLAAALEVAGLPGGVLNVVTGASRRVADPVLDDDRVRAMSFTGSTAVGLHLQHKLAGRMRVQTEMGGKNASLVLPDADLDMACSTVVAGAMGQTGQRCTATSRVVVHRDVAAAFEEALSSHLGSLVVGSGLDDETAVGPLATDQQLDEALAAVTQASSDGARVATGGQRLRGSRHDGGHFMAPTLLCDVSPDSAAWREEIFGPVLAMTTVDTFEAGVVAVDDSDYGLSASIFTRSLESAHRFVDAVDVGQVAVNLPTTGWDVHVPFGGFKQSGSPFKEHGIRGLDFYTRVKSVALGFGLTGS